MPDDLNAFDLVKVNEIEEFVPRLEQLLEQGKAHERHLRDQANAQRTENGRIEKALNAITKTKDPKPKASRASTPNISPGRVEQVREFFRQNKGRELTSKELSDHFDWSSGQVSMAIKVLRENEEVRYTGKVVGPTGRGVTKAYALMD